MSRRQAILRLTPESLVRMLQVSHKGYRFKVVENSLPEDAEFLGANFDHQYGCFFIRLESEEFKKVEECCVLPVLENPVVETTSDGHANERYLRLLLNDLLPGLGSGQYIDKHGMEKAFEDGARRLKEMRELLSDYEEKQ